MSSITQTLPSAPKILSLISSRPGINDAEIADELSLDIDFVKTCVASLTTSTGRLLSVPRTAPNGQRINHYFVREGAAVSEKPVVKPARAFTDAERSLIKKVHGYIPAAQLLGILNERLASDLGPDVRPHTMEQLHAEIGSVAAPAGGHSWASLRKLLVQAERNGVLSMITEQVINDFAVVFSVTPKQVVGLKDILLQRQENKQ